MSPILQLSIANAHPFLHTCLTRAAPLLKKKKKKHIGRGKFTQYFECAVKNYLCKRAMGHLLVIDHCLDLRLVRRTVEYVTDVHYALASKDINAHLLRFALLKKTKVATFPKTGKRKRKKPLP